MFSSEINGFQSVLFYFYIKNIRFRAVWDEKKKRYIATETSGTRDAGLSTERTGSFVFRLLNNSAFFLHNCEFRFDDAPIASRALPMADKPICNMPLC